MFKEDNNFPAMIRNKNLTLEAQEHCGRGHNDNRTRILILWRVTMGGSSQGLVGNRKGRVRTLEAKATNITFEEKGLEEFTLFIKYGLI